MISGPQLKLMGILIVGDDTSGFVMVGLIVVVGATETEVITGKWQT